MTTRKTEQSSAAPPKRHWHRKPGQKIDDLLLKRHRHAAQRYAPLARLIRQSDQRQSLTQAVRALLPDGLGDTVEVVNFRAPSLVLRVSNASLATRLRYSLPDLTTKLRNLSDFDGLTRINLRVVQTSTPEVPESQPRYLPAEAARSLADFAELLQEQPDYRQLGDTILRLSEHTAATGSDESPETAAATEVNAASGESQPKEPAASTGLSSPGNDTIS